MEAKQDSNPRYRTVSVCIKGLILRSIWSASSRYRSKKTLILWSFKTIIIATQWSL